MKLLTVIIILAITTACGHSADHAAIAPTQPQVSPPSQPTTIPNKPLTVSEQMLADLPKFKAWALEHNTSLNAPMPSLQRAILLRHLVYASVPFAADGHILDDKELATPFDTFTYIVNGGENSYRCGGIHRFYQLFLAAFGIQSRYVGIFSGITPTGEGHAATDVLVDGIWIALDATLDASIRDASGAYLSWEEARILRGSTVWNDDGYLWTAAKDPNVWAPTFNNEMLEYVVVFPSPFETIDNYYSPDGKWAGRLELTWDTIDIGINNVDLDPDMNLAIKLWLEGG